MNKYVSPTLWVIAIAPYENVLEVSIEEYPIDPVNPGFSYYSD